MQVIKRLPDRGYIDTSFWLPKAYCNVEGVKNALTFDLTKDGKPNVLVLWRETPSHLLVPREFWNTSEGGFDFPIIDCRPISYSRMNITSRVKLDHLPNAQGILVPTGEDVQEKSMSALLPARGGILQLACGRGKTVTALDFIARKKVPTLIVVDTTQLVEQWSKAINLFLDIPDGVGMMGDGRFDWKHPVVIATYHTLAARAATLPEEIRRWFGMVIWDECFVAGTRVDGRAIETIVEGDKVTSFNHGTEIFERREVRRLFRKRPQALLRVRTEDGKEIVCTPNHPFFTPDGYRPAGLLKEGDHVTTVDPDTVRLVQRTPDGDQEVAARQAQGGEESLLHSGARELGTHGALVEDDGRNEQETCIEENARAQSYAGSRGPKEDGGIPTRDGTSTESARGQRAPAAGRTASSGRTSWMEDGVHRSDGDSMGRIADALQGRHREPQGEDRDRGGRFFSHLFGTQSAGRKEGGVLDLTRVVHLEVLEPGSDGRFGGVCPDGHVYNLEVGENHNYIANGFLVHNCHHVAAPTFARSADLFFGHRFGLTATPERSDGQHVIYNFHIGKVLFKDLTQKLKPKIEFLWTGLSLDPQDPWVQGETRDKNGELHIGKTAVFFGQWRERLRFVLAEIQKRVKQGRKILVLSQSVDEAVNLLALWTGKSDSDLYTNIPMPTERDVEEQIAPAGLSTASRNGLVQKIAEYRNLLKDRALNPVKRQSFEEKVSNLKYRLEQDRVAKKVEALHRKWQRQYLEDLLKMPSTGGLMIYKVEPSERTAMLRSKQVTFAIMKYGKEGLDEPALDTVIISTPISDRNTLQQIMGRPARPKEGKEEPLVVFLEDNVGPMIGMCVKLRSHLKAWPVEESGPFDYEMVNNPSSMKRSQWKQQIRASGQ